MDRTNFVFFWKPLEQNGWLSNWSPHPLIDNGIIFKTAEHFIMYHKALLMGDTLSANKILMTKYPSEAKAIGRQIKHWNKKKWENLKKIIFTEIKIVLILGIFVFKIKKKVLYNHFIDIK